MDISIVIPVYNEEKRILDSLKKIIQFLKLRKHNYEIIIVDDGSSDKTIEVANSLKNKKINVLKNNVNKGKGYSVRKGILSATKELILFTDADLSAPIDELDVFLDIIKQYDVVIGSRGLKESNVIIHQPFFREFSGKVFNLIVQLFVIRGIKDTQCGFKLFKKGVAHGIFTKQRLDGFSFDVEVIYLAKKYGYNIKEQPVRWLNNKDTKVTLLKDGVKMFLDITRIRWNDLFSKYD
ncbi:glycosyltransferase family 2 protein [Candidatus Woesearchaeota archaeon]|nr:glycosyltransferase family 2 protein [Candidatus Woesearchaeota archaeon]